MTRKQIDVLTALYVDRDMKVAKLAALARDERPNVEVQIVVAGSGYRMALPKPYITAQWTAELLHVERRIRAAGGTL